MVVEANPLFYTPRMTILTALLIFSMNAFAQTNSSAQSELPASNVIMGRGIQSNENETLLLACVGQGPTHHIPTCDQVRLVLFRPGQVPTWAGFPFASLDLVRIQQDLKRWYSETSITGFFRFLSENEMYSLTSQNGWSWANRPLQVDGKTFKRILSSISAYSYLENSKSGEKVTVYSHASTAAPMIALNVNPVQSQNGKMAVPNGDTCLAKMEEGFKAANEVYQNNEALFKLVEQRFKEVEQIADQTRKSVEAIFSPLNPDQILVDSQLVSVTRVREYLAYRKSVLEKINDPKEKEIQLQSFENPSATNFSLKASTSATALKKYIAEQERELSAQVNLPLNRWRKDAYSSDKSSVTLELDPLQQLRDVKVCLDWRAIGSLGATHAFLTTDLYCYSMMDKSNSFDLWKGIKKEKMLFFVPGKQFNIKDVIYLDAFHRLQRMSSLTKNCIANSENLHLIPSMKEQFLDVLLYSKEIEPLFLGPVFTYAEFEALFTSHWNEFMMGKTLPELPAERSSKRGLKEVRRILEESLPNLHDDFYAFLQAKYGIPVTHFQESQRKNRR